ncbi:MAG: A/G-specific adenine glycosylase [Aeromicrobium sp.]
MTTFPAKLPEGDLAQLHEQVIDWFDREARDLPWRRAASAWAVTVSEFMLQQTPVSRVLPVYEAWIERWPTPAALADSSTGDAVRAWGRLGYPRRALRLHAAATAIVAEHDGAVPTTLDELLALPGVGEYTAAAVASFAHEQRHPVLDTNVRRVFARIVSGEQFPAATLTSSERDLAAALLPEHDAHRWAAATMELGALVCTARAPVCVHCPVADLCRWRRAGYPAYDGPPRRGQAWAGTDRQCRGRLMAVLRDSPIPVPKVQLDLVWSDAIQRERALDGLVADGLVEPVDDDSYALPS